LTIAQPVAALAAAFARCDWFTAVGRRRAPGARRRVPASTTWSAALASLAAMHAPTPDAAAERLAGAVQERCPAAARPNSVWWSGDAGDGREFRCFAPLPPASAFASLLGAAP
jgi:hypothetical protein